MLRHHHHVHVDLVSAASGRLGACWAVPASPALPRHASLLRSQLEDPMLSTHHIKVLGASECCYLDEAHRFGPWQDVIGGHMEHHSSIVCSAFRPVDSALLSMAQLLPSQTTDGLFALATLPPPDQLALGGATAVLTALYILKVGL